MKFKIVEIRMKKGYSSAEVARKAGIAKSTLNDIENNKSNPRIETLELVAKALDVKISDLLDSPYA